MSAVRLLEDLDPTFAWDGTRLYDPAELGPTAPIPCRLRGAAVTARATDDASRWRLLRDPLGIGKLFWAGGGDQDLAVSSRLRPLLDAGYRFEDIRALPPGTVVDLDFTRGRSTTTSILPPTWFARDGSGETSVPAAAAAIRTSLDRYLAALASALPRARVYVCLSGGLDSSGIAVVAAEHFPDAVAVSFDLAGAGRRASDDRRTAARLAADLNLALLEADTDEDGLLAHLDSVLVAGIDWRDFNVHAALVNACLAEAIAAAAAAEPDRPALVLTGDLSNEFLVDYEPERYRGAVYYDLPRIRPHALRTSLVRGLDSSHREVGIFRAYGLPLVQPYAAAADAYLALPAEFLALPDRKQQLCAAVFGTRLPSYIYERKKVRAQVGDAGGGGVLALCVDRGLDADVLRRRFARLHGLRDTAPLDRFLRAGRYRAAAPELNEA